VAGTAVEPLTVGVEGTATTVTGCVTGVTCVGVTWVLVGVASELAPVAGAAVVDCTTGVTGAPVDAVELGLALVEEAVAVLA
jgi:hypothetical protein